MCWGLFKVIYFCVTLLLKEEDFVAVVVVTGGAVSCFSIHIGEIRPGGVRGNHRHHTCNETFVIWGAKTLFRVWFLLSTMLSDLWMLLMKSVINCVLNHAWMVSYEYVAFKYFRNLPRVFSVCFLMKMLAFCQLSL